MAHVSQSGRTRVMCAGRDSSTSGHSRSTSRDTLRSPAVVSARISSTRWRSCATTTYSPATCSVRRRREGVFTRSTPSTSGEGRSRRRRKFATSRWRATSPG
ncbi:hypothetical protein PMAYCL1PPCAC_11358 [Pristionchus mayeri]|uniref:Uncharacterized protein n=1 Tax=Pristionchus mayeri TaxID=1317129 RepID=A0AAN5C862_9BILA|nr:hypothetical protein PMAYCL1PPCAC_11358 [Pristionchus mayeri]